MDDLNGAIGQVYKELEQVYQVKKCANCECLLDILEGIQDDLLEIGTPGAEEIRAQLQRWPKEGNQKRHRCLGCEVCLPVEPYNQFSALWRAGKNGAATLLSPVEVLTPPPCNCGGACGTKPAQQEITHEWPIVKGDYLVGNPSASVAICTLADTDLPAELKAAGVLERAAIIGPLATENLGIERVVRNVVANPNIGFLVLCGRDSRGHRAGQAILALKDNGIDGNQRIVGAQGPRPVLKNITADEIEAFQQNVTLVDEIGTRDVPRLVDVIEACLARPNESKPTLPPKIHLSKVIEAQRLSNREWVHDPEGFFVVLLDREERVIICEHYMQDGVLNEVIRGSRAGDVANTAIRRGLLSRLDHASYLGRELAKAEAALALGLTYRQDKPLKEEEMPQIN